MPSPDATAGAGHVGDEREARLLTLWELVDDDGRPVPFGALVKAQRAMQDTGVSEQVHQRRRELWSGLRAKFEAQHGPITNEYYCRHAVGGAAATQGRGARRARRSMPALHTVLNSKVERLLTMESRVGQLSADAAAVFGTRRPEQLAVANDVCYDAMTNVLAAAERCAKVGVDPRERRAAIAAAAQRVEYVSGRATVLVQRQARFDYLLGVLAGALLLLVVAGMLGVVAAAHWSSTFDASALTAAMLFGILGAVASVFQRMSRGQLVLDYNAPLHQKYLLGAMRPLVGAVLAVVIQFALTAGLFLTATPEDGASFAFFAVAGFAAGFSERLATDLIERAGQVLAGTQPPKNPPAGGEPDSDSNRGDGVTDDELADLSPRSPAAASLRGRADRDEQQGRADGTLVSRAEDVRGSPGPQA